MKTAFFKFFEGRFTVFFGDLKGLFYQSGSGKIGKFLLKYRYLIAFILFIVLVSAKINYSSIGCWDGFITQKSPDYIHHFLINAPRSIRSDEFLAQDPSTLSQALNPSYFPLINRNLGPDGQNMLLGANGLVFHITVVGKPANWGYLLFGKDVGFSWWWNLRIILLFLFSFELFLILTDHPMASFIGALALTFSPMVQWWLSTGVTDLLISTEGIILCIWFYFKSETIGKKIFLAVLFSISSIGFLTLLYPPIQVPLGYLILIFFIFTVITNFKTMQLKRKDWILFALTAGFIFLSFGLFIHDSMDAIQLLANTAYPGKRTVLWSGIDPSIFYNYLINWKFPFMDVSYSNNCEMSTILNLFPAVLLVFFKVYKEEKSKKFLMVALMGYSLFMMIWGTVPLPQWFAKYSLFSYVVRVHIPFGVLALMLSIWTFVLIEKNKLFKWYEAGMIALMVTAFYYIIFKNNNAMYLYLGKPAYLFTLLFFFILNFSFVFGMKRLFPVCMIIYILVSGFTINPVTSGLDPIYHKVIAKKIYAIDNKDKGQLWAGANSILNGDYLAALGMKSFDCVQVYPDFKMWKALDPSGKYMNNYNRYTHEVLYFSQTNTYFESPQPDLMIIHLDYNDLGKTGIRYILSSGVISNKKLMEMDKVVPDNLYIYKVTNE